MADWKIVEQRVVPQGIEDVSTTQKLPIGTLVRARHITYGEATFIYLKGVVSTVAGSNVTYKEDTGLTALLATSAIGPTAVAMAATVADTWGWYMRVGVGNALSGDVAESGKVYIDTVPGKVDDAVVASNRVKGAKFVSADDTATGKALMRIDWPFVDGQKDAT